MPNVLVRVLVQELLFVPMAKEALEDVSSSGDGTRAHVGRKRTHRRESSGNKARPSPSSSAVLTVSRVQSNMVRKAASLSHTNLGPPSPKVVLSPKGENTNKPTVGDNAHQLVEGSNASTETSTVGCR